MKVIQEIHIERRYMVVCRFCGQYAPPGYSVQEAKEVAIEAGWFEDMCPDCQDRASWGEHEQSQSSA